MADLKSNVVLSLIDRVTGPARGLTATMNRLQGMAQRANRELRLPDAGAVMAAILPRPRVGHVFAIGRALDSASRAAGEFEAEMARVRILSGASGAQFQALEKQALDLGRATRFSARQAAEAQGFLAMAGFEADGILGATPATLQLAAAANLDLARAADVVSNVLSGYRLDVSDLGRVNDVLAQSFFSSKVDLRQLGEGLRHAGPAASAAGLRFEEVSAALGLMGAAGVEGSASGASLHDAISRMLDPTAAMTRSMRQAGLRFKDAQGRMLPLVDVVAQLEPHAEDAGLMMQLFGQRAGPAMAALVAKGSSELRRRTRELEQSEGVARRAVEAQTSGYQGAMTRFASAAESAEIAFGRLVSPSVERFLDRVTEKLDALTAFLDTIPNRITLFDRIDVAWQAFSTGFAGRDGSGFLDAMRPAIDLFTRGIFGSTETFEEDANALAGISNTFRRLGRDFRGFTDALAGGEIGVAMGHLGDVLGGMNGWGSVLALFAAAAGVGLLASGLKMLAQTPLFRLLLVAGAVATLISAATNAGSFGEFVDHLKELSTFDWAVLAVGLALIGGQFLAIGAGVRLIVGGIGRMAGGLRAILEARRRLGAGTNRGRRGRGGGAGTSPGRRGRGGGAGRAPRPPPASPAPGGRFGSRLREMWRVAPRLLPLGGVGGAAANSLLMGAVLKVGLPGIAAAVVGYGLYKLHEDFSEQRREDERRAATPRAAERSSMHAWRRYQGSGDFDEDMDELRHERGERRSSAPVDVETANASLGRLLGRGDRVDVNVLNPPQRPNVTVGPITVFAGAGESADDLGRRLGREAAAAVEGAFSDGGM